MQQADIIVVGSPVYFGSATPEVMALLDRAGYVAKANGNLFARKVGGPIAVARRAGHNFTFAQLLMWYMINDMIVPGSSYWNVALAREAGSVNQDAEALGTIDRFADNLAWLAEKISAGTTRGCLKGATLTHSHNSTLQGLGTHHTSVQTTDLDASLRFYRDVMGMVEVAKFEASGRQVYLLDIGDGTHLELFGPSSSVPQPVLQEAPYRHLALYVEDVPQAVAIVRAAGRPIKVEPKQVVLAGRQTTVAFFEGPSGELVEFFHPDFP
jgi:catechol 2,3-dioxygenase-like lactoylglutathione lyase family enzyme